MGVDVDNVLRRNRPRKPWALLLAVLILLGVEIALRISGWPKKIPYELELDEYYAVSAAIDRYPMPDIVVVGSSRAREGLDLPLLREQLSQLTGKPYTIGNYAVSGGRAYVFEAIVRRLLREPTLPKLIILGGAERDLGTDAAMYDQASLYWNFSDWRAAWRRRGGAVLDDLPIVLRNAVGRWYTTLGLREQLALKARQLISHHEDQPTQVEGELTVWQHGNPKHSLVRSPAGDVAAYARSVARPPFPNTRMSDALNELAATCQQKHVPLMIFQVPIPRVLEQNVPKGTENKYVSVVKRIAADHDASFIAAAALQTDLSDRNFRDASHLNLSGADLVTAGVAKEIVKRLAIAPASQPSVIP